MGRILKPIEIGGEARNALFDSGANRSYVVRRVLPPGVRLEAVTPAIRVGLGGRTHELREEVHLSGKLEALPVTFDAYVVEELGRVDGQAIDLLLGAPAMEKYEIRLDPSGKALDLEALRKREFVDF